MSKFENKEHAEILEYPDENISNLQVQSLKKKAEFLKKYEEQISDL